MIRIGKAEWSGSVREGNGKVELGSGLLTAPYSFHSRFESGAGTNPEELIGAAHAGCFSMALSLLLTEAGHAPQRVATTARVSLVKAAAGFTIDRIDLETEVSAGGLAEERLQELARRAKEDCPVSRALAGVGEIGLTAKLRPT